MEFQVNPDVTAGFQIQVLRHVEQELYRLSYLPSPPALLFFFFINL